MGHARTLPSMSLLHPHPSVQANYGDPPPRQPVTSLGEGVKTDKNLIALVLIVSGELRRGVVVVLQLHANF